MPTWLRSTSCSPKAALSITIEVAASLLELTVEEPPSAKARAPKTPSVAIRKTQTAKTHFFIGGTLPLSQSILNAKYSR